MSAQVLPFAGGPGCANDCDWLCGPREEAVLRFVTAIEIPLLAAVKAEYWHERGWRVCGPASLALAWLTYLYTGVPIRQSGHSEHLRLMVLVYPDQPMDHVLIGYHTGCGDVFCIDLTGDLYWRGYPRLEGAMHISCFGLGEMPLELKEQFRLEHFESTRANQIGLHNILVGDRTPSRQEDYQDLLAALHSPKALMSRLPLPSGRSIDPTSYWSKRVLRVMKATIHACPDFVVYPEAAAELGWLLDLLETV